MNILITGAAGFIGRKVAYNLKNLGYNIIIIDFITKITIKLKEDFICYGFDISLYSNFKQIKENIDIIIHIAAQSGGYNSLVEPELDCDWNCKGTLNIVNFAKYKKVKKLIYTSSMAVYGNGSILKETDEPKPISNYGVSKLSGEYYVKTLSEYNIPYTILRLFNTYGFGQDMNNMKQGMVSIYLSQALKNKKIDVTGSFDRIRDFIYIDDVVSVIKLSLINSKTNNEIYNVCSATQTTVKELLDMIKNLFDEHIEIKEIEGYSGDQFNNSGDNEKLKLLGWESKTSLHEGLNNFYNNETRKINSNNTSKIGIAAN